MFIDTHCHLAHKRLNDATSDYLTQAADFGVYTVLCAASDLEESRAAGQLAADYRGVFALAGIHPHEAKTVTAEGLDEIRSLLDAPRCVALGEIGLDYHYDFSPRETQRDAFAAQLAIAAETSMPVVIHTREAFEDTMRILRESAVDKSAVLFHSFTGNADEAREVIDLGCSISYSGIMTFKNAEDIRAAAKVTPLDKLMIETDAPFLSPEPVRSVQPNTPAHVLHVATRLAEVRETSLEEIGLATTANAERFFSLPPMDGGAV
ncbi:MAG: TatD family hydrolase [Phycisphaerales bacterium]|jgi:TatD DNase family protein|nr:TatD family hydrolase [Phycisphaerales bacterium]MBT7171054.1 TatD family hydrolase [Phycisphaerales bacterium]